MSIVNKISPRISTQNAEVNSSDTIKLGGILAIVYILLFRYLYNQTWSLFCDGWSYYCKKGQFFSTHNLNLELVFTIIASIFFCLTIFAFRNLLFNRYKSLKFVVGLEYLLSFIPFFNFIYLVYLSNLKENNFISFADYVEKQKGKREDLMLRLFLLVLVGGIVYTFIVVIFSIKNPTLSDVFAILTPVGIFCFYFIFNVLMLRYLKYYVIVFIAAHLIYYYVQANVSGFHFSTRDMIFLGKPILFTCISGLILHTYFHYNIEEDIAPETRDDYLEMFEV